MKQNYCTDCNKKISPYASRCGSCAVKRTVRERGDGVVSIVCQFCERVFVVGKSRAEAGNGLYCSRKCTDEGKKARNTVMIVCVVCGQEFRATKYAFQNGRKCCSGECGKKVHIKRDRRLCIQCEVPFSVVPSSRRKFCSRPCYWQWRSENIRGEAHPTWLGGARVGEYPEDFDDTLKEMIRERDGNRCVLCGDTEDRLLPVHHIDYDKDNSSPSNLITLCSMHHGATGSNREYWSSILPTIMSCTVSLRI